MEDTGLYFLLPSPPQKKGMKDEDALVSQAINFLKKKGKGWVNERRGPEGSL